MVRVTGLTPRPLFGRVYSAGFTAGISYRLSVGGVSSDPGNKEEHVVSIGTPRGGGKLPTRRVPNGPGARTF